ncbi:uncharacterized protein LOC120631376 [Pararge aegeria]|uniref:uncharacterized protein LOC120631376 n=1 Tax=Pararge aegeria TaxID=116150 RepID=UPI0019D0F6C2|nr:uncharacterized protein LOC120631376 [Pararge aegeria]
MRIIEVVVQDKKIISESPELIKLNETIELSDMSNNISNKQMFEIITEGHSKVLELPVEENKTQVRNEHNIYKPSGRKSNGIMDMTNKELESYDTKAILLAKDIDTLSTPSSDNANGINERIDTNKNNQSSDMIIETDNGNNAKELHEDMSAGNIEQKENGERPPIILSANIYLAKDNIFKRSSEDIINHAETIVCNTLNGIHFDVANDENQFAKLTDDTPIKAEFMSPGNIQQQLNEEHQSEKPFWADKLIIKSSSEDVNHTVKIDYTSDSHHYEVAGYQNQLTELSTDTLTKDDRIDKNTTNNVHNTASQMEAMDFTPDDSIKKLSTKERN